MKPIEAITQEVLQDRAELVRSLTAVLERTKPGTPTFKKLTQELTDILNPTSTRNLGHVGFMAPRSAVGAIGAIACGLAVKYALTYFRKKRHA